MELLLIKCTIKMDPCYQKFLQETKQNREKGSKFGTLFDFIVVLGVYCLVLPLCGYGLKVPVESYDLQLFARNLVVVAFLTFISYPLSRSVSSDIDTIGAVSVYLDLMIKLCFNKGVFVRFRVQRNLFQIIVAKKLSYSCYYSS